jgi:hypothetical protein
MSTGRAAWYDHSWIEWVGLAGVILTLAGLWLTWLQARKATTAAEAARTAVSRTEVQLRANQLLVLIPQLRWLTGELDAAIDAGEPIWARRHLESWRWHASNVRGLLSVADNEQKKILKALQDSVSQAASAGEVLRARKVPVADATHQARTSIGRACDELIGWVGQSATTSGFGTDEKGIS